MIALLQQQFEHLWWAQQELAGAVLSPEAKELAGGDLKGVLHHMVMVRRAFQAIIAAESFDTTRELLVPEQVETVLEAAAAVAGRERQLLGGLDAAALERKIFVQWFQAELSVGDLLLQVVLHDQNHRGQCLMLLRQAGLKPPTLDFILWASKVRG